MEAARDTKQSAIGSSKLSIRYGCTEDAIDDQGREFVNRLRQDLFKLTKTKHWYIHRLSFSDQWLG